MMLREAWQLSALKPSATSTTIFPISNRVKWIRLVLILKANDQFSVSLFWFSGQRVGPSVQRKVRFCWQTDQARRGADLLLRRVERRGGEPGAGRSESAAKENNVIIPIPNLGTRNSYPKIYFENRLQIIIISPQTALESPLVKQVFSHKEFDFNFETNPWMRKLLSLIEISKYI